VIQCIALDIGSEYLSELVFSFSVPICNTFYFFDSFLLKLLGQELFDLLLKIINLDLFHWWVNDFIILINIQSFDFLGDLSFVLLLGLVPRTSPDPSIMFI
jgi:hypothetical protein